MFTQPFKYKFLKKKSYNRAILSRLYEIVLWVYEIVLIVLFGCNLPSSPNNITGIFRHTVATGVVVVLAPFVFYVIFVDSPTVSR